MSPESDERTNRWNSSHDSSTLSSDVVSIMTTPVGALDV